MYKALHIQIADRANGKIINLLPLANHDDEVHIADGIVKVTGKEVITEEIVSYFLHMNNYDIRVEYAEIQDEKS